MPWCTVVSFFLYLSECNKQPITKQISNDQSEKRDINNLNGQCDMTYIEEIGRKLGIRRKYENSLNS